MLKDFLLTYSFKNKYSNIESDSEKADKIRRDIAGLTCWKKLENVENVEKTFSGDMDITGISDSDKKSSARKKYPQRVHSNHEKT